jgi:16S rRNA (uracil1498-N3)-methyltransferase
VKDAQRLFVTAALAEGADVPLDAGQAHYLAHVLRLQPGADIAVFNGTNGEWVARLDAVGRKAASLTCVRQVRAQDGVPALTLAFAPIKGDRVDAIAEKATELGVAALQPVITERTIVRKLNTARLNARCVEAAEQTGRLTVPTVSEASTLEKLLATSMPGVIVFADEAGDAHPVATALALRPSRCWSGLRAGSRPASGRACAGLPMCAPSHSAPASCAPTRPVLLP